MHARTGELAHAFVIHPPSGRPSKPAVIGAVDHVPALDSLRVTGSCNNVRSCALQAASSVAASGVAWGYLKVASITIYTFSFFLGISTSCFALCDSTTSSSALHSILFTSTTDAPARIRAAFSDCIAGSLDLSISFGRAACLVAHGRLRRRHIPISRTFARVFENLGTVSGHDIEKNRILSPAPT